MYFNNILSILHPGQDGYVRTARLSCDLQHQCPELHNQKHCLKYFHDPEINLDLPNPAISERLVKNNFKYHTAEGRILQERYARQNLLFPGVNTTDCYMLDDPLDRMQYNYKLKKEVAQQNNLLNPMLPIDASQLPQKFESRKLFQLRQISLQDERDLKHFRKTYHVKKPLYNADQPKERIKDLLQKKRTLRERAKDRRQALLKPQIRKDFNNFTIMYVNSNDPLKQFNDIFTTYGHCDIIVLSELTLPPKYLDEGKIFPSDVFDVFYHMTSPQKIMKFR